MRVWVAFVGGAALAAGCFVAWQCARDWPTRELGILVGGQVPPADEPLGSWLVRRAPAIAARRAILLTDSGALELSFADLGLTLDAARSASQARDPAAPSPSPIARLRGL